VKELQKALYSNSAAALLQQAEATHGEPSLTPPQGALIVLAVQHGRGLMQLSWCIQHSLEMADFLKLLTELKYDICAALLCFRTFVCIEHGLSPPQGAVPLPE